MGHPGSHVVVITGAGSGLGRAAALEFLSRGHRVVLAGRRREPLAALAAEQPQALAVPTDVADPASVRALFAEVVRVFGRVDVLFNNAGTFGPAAPVGEITDGDWNTTWATNVSGSVFCAREAVNVMLAQNPHGGRIINNGSISAHRPRPRSLAYTVTKHAVSGLTASMALDLRDLGIAVTQIDIGNAATAMTAGIGARALQADGTYRAEPTIDAAHVARSIVHIAELPLEVAVPTITVMARQMPYFGRG